MANTKISQLPSYTGSAADIRWFVMNNSGETETYKYSGYSGQLIIGTGSNSYRTPDAIATNNSSVAIGNGANAQGDDAVSIGNTFGNAVGFRSVVIGRHPYPPGSQNVVVGSGAYIYGNNSIAIGHETSTVSNAIVIGSNTSRASGNYSITLGHQNERNQSEYTNILGTNNRVGQAPNFLGSPYSSIIGSNNLVETDAGYGYNNILGGNSNTITGTTSGTTLIGISNYTGPLLNDTAYVNNLQVLRTPSTRVQPVFSGTVFTCNLDNGAKSQFYLTGTSTINITNVRDGASFMIKTQTTGNHTITWTATGGYTFLFEGGIKDPGNNVTDIFVFEVFGSVIYGNRRHNYL